MKLNRTLYRILLIASFLMLNAFIIMGISAVISYLNTGADRSSMLHLPEKLSPNYLPKIVWSPLKNEGRPMEKQTLADIERDYLKAWYIKNHALEQNTTNGVADYYTDSARLKLFKIINLNKTNNTYFKSITLSHQPTLNFYSVDGKMVVLTDEHLEYYEEAYQNNVLIAKKKATASYQITLLLEDGFWRIRHMVKLPNKVRVRTQNTALKTTTIQQSKGINYYPKKTPWAMFGNQFDTHTINSDFEKITKLGLNSVRIFIPYQAFGKAQIDTVKIKQLKTTFDIAAKHDLKIIATLFDFYGDYSLNNWTLTHRHTEQIITELKNHPALLAWDIKNEPDLDFDSRGKDKVISWLEQMILQIKLYDTRHPITIGWSNPQAAENLADKVDFVSFHYYENPEEFKSAYVKLKLKITNKPIVLQEYGISSYDGIYNAYLGSEENQADYYKTMQQVLEEEAIPFFLWTLYDFENVPDEVVGKLPWRKAYQKHYGLIDSENKHKKAYGIISKI